MCETERVCVCVQNKSIIYCMAMANEAVVNMSLPFQQMYTMSFYFLLLSLRLLWLLVFYEMHCEFVFVFFFFTFRMRNSFFFC